MKRVNLLFVAILITISAFTQSKVAVFDPEDKNNTGYAEVIREMLSTGLSKSTYYKPVERVLINKVLEENKYQNSGMVDDSKISELGKQMGADYVCVSMIQKMGTNYFITVKLVNVTTASVEFQEYVKTIDGENDLFEKVDALAGKLAGAKQQPGTVGKTPAQQSANNSSYTVTVGGVSFNMIYVQGGSFEMGSNTGESDEKPIHTVTVSDYSIAEFEVTQELWQAVMGTTVRMQRDKENNSWPLRGEGSNYPMYYVSWNEAQEFINELNRRTGKNFRLPTEVEWEYAARGGNKSVGYQYAGSNNLNDVAWNTDNSGSATHPVGQKRANELGLYDMSGNVWEWCSDWYGDYSTSAQTNPKGASSGSYRVYRGGSWDDRAYNCRSAYRFSALSTAPSTLGFRLVSPK